MKSIVAFVSALACFALPILAHEVRPAYLQIRQTGPETYDILWKVPAGGDERLVLDVQMPKDTSVISPRQATVLQGALTERWSIQRPSGLTGSTITIEGLSATLTDALVRLERLDGTTQVARLTPASPSLTIEANPSGFQAAKTYALLGIEHILMGVDHLLFVLGLLLLVDNRWMLLKTITSFTIAHSITLAIATLGYASAPLPPLNAAIALSILFLAPEIARKYQG